MSQIALRCTECNFTCPPDMTTLECGKCGSPLDVEYLDGDVPRRERAGRYIPPTPLADRGKAVSLGEGNTPCIELPAIAHRLGIRTLFSKIESLSPTGAFKDRGTTVTISMAVQHGVKEVVEDSSGNAGASVAAYAARAGIRAHIFVPASAPAAKLVQVRAYGATLHPIEGPREEATKAARKYVSEHGVVYLSHILSPYFQEGTKTLVYEVLSQVTGGMPAHIVFPVGNGSLIIGAYKGLLELQKAGAIKQMPRLHCVQTQQIMPLTAEYNGLHWSPASAGKTIAGGIATASPPRGRQVLRCVKATGGSAVAVSEDSIVRWRIVLAQEEGVYAEPTSAATFAGLEQLVSAGVIKPDEPVLAPVTGFGLKDPG